MCVCSFITSFFSDWVTMDIIYTLHIQWEGQMSGGPPSLKEASDSNKPLCKPSQPLDHDCGKEAWHWDMVTCWESSRQNAPSSGIVQEGGVCSLHLHFADKLHALIRD